MKKLYILVFLFLQSIFAISQIEIRLVDPGEPGIMRVQFRSIDPSVLPTTEDFLTDMSFRIWWDNAAHPLITDIDVTPENTYGQNLNELAPAQGSSTGSGPNDGLVVPFQFCSTCDFINFPTNWVLNEWVTAATINICSSMGCGVPPPGITAADFLIQLPFDGYPNLGMNFTDDYTPSLGLLPLNLLSFKAAKNGDRSSSLSWITTNEENTSHFTVERSFDRVTWTNIGSVEAAGYSLGIEHYSFDDMNVYNGRDSRLNVYYRLNMVDRDNSAKLSPTKSVVFASSSTSQGFAAYPNPASEGIHVEWTINDVEQPTMLEFYDLTGQLIYTQVVPEKSNQEYVDFTKTNILPGLYFLRIMSGDIPVDYKQVVVDLR